MVPITTDNTALVLHDLQNDFIGDALSDPEMADTFERIGTLTDVARSNSIPIIYTRYEFDPAVGYPAERAPYLEHEHSPCIKGTTGADIVEEFRPSDDDFVITKFRHSAFYNTNLEGILRSKGIWILLLTGGGIDWGVEWMARDARERDILPIAIEDCTYSPREGVKSASLNNFRNFIGAVMTSDEVAAILAN